MIPLYFAAALTFLVPPTQPSPPREVKPVVVGLNGYYRVRGQTEDGAYTGILVVRKEKDGDHYRVQWFAEGFGGGLVGVGQLDGKVLAIGWTIPGKPVVGLCRYTITLDDKEKPTLAGTWSVYGNPAKNKETLTWITGLDD